VVFGGSSGFGEGGGVGGDLYQVRRPPAWAGATTCPPTPAARSQLVQPGVWLNSTRNWEHLGLPVSFPVFFENGWVSILSEDNSRFWPARPSHD
jgi:hypothetical protein